MGGPGGPGDIFVREIKGSAVGLSYNFENILLRGYL